MPKKTIGSRGKEALENAVEAASGNFEPTKFVKFEPGQETLLRFLTDIEDIVIVKMHQRVFCSDGKARSFVCKEMAGEECVLCERDVKKSSRIHGIAVLREPVFEGKEKVGYKDVVEENSEGKLVPFVGIVQQAPTNFWNYFTEAAREHKTLIDREYAVKRIGKGKTTGYSIWEKEDSVLEIPNMLGNMKCPKCDYKAELGEAFEGSECPECETVMEGEPGRYDKYVPDLNGFLGRQASDEYYAKHLTGVDLSGSNEDDEEDDDFEAKVAKEAKELKAAAAGAVYD